jgi:ABC-type protease/lipase transport system fused ATPase/permease subunit
MVGLSLLQELLIRKSMKMAGQLNIKSHRFVDSFMRNAEVINGMGMIRDISDRFVEKNNRVMINQTKSSYYAGTIQSMIKPLQNVVQVLIYCFGAVYAIKEGFDVGLMVAGSIIMGRGFGPLMQFMSSWRTTATAKESYLRLSSFSSMLDRIVPGMPLPPPKGHVCVAGAGYRIPSRMLLKAVSFELPAGELLGVIGPNGAGKTTLCSLLLGILPAFVGKVYLDGKDIFSWDKAQVGPYIGYLPQEIELFPGTVAQNIARLGPVDMDRVEQAIQTCGIQGLVDSFPQGLSTQLEGDKGVRLSGGQKQLVGLARALYGSPRLLVLDEPTSNLDEQGEQLLVNILAGMKERRNCTCIMVSHKPQLLHAMDKVLVINAGQVAMFGPRDAVFAKLSGKQAAL